MSLRWLVPLVGAGGGNGSLPKILAGLRRGKMLCHHLGSFPQRRCPQYRIGGSHPLEERGEGGGGDGFNDLQFAQPPFFFPKAMR